MSEHAAAHSGALGRVDMSPLPIGWVWVDFQNVTEIVATTGKKIKQRDYLMSGRLPVVDQGKELIGGYTDSLDHRLDVSLPVIVFGDHTRTIKYINFCFAAGADGIKVIKPREAFDPKLMYYFLQAVALPDRGYSRHFQFLRKTRLPLPPLPEQHRIVVEIETQFTRLDAGVAALKRVQATLRRYKAALLKAACEGRLVPTEAELARVEGRPYEPASALLERILAERRVQWQQANPGKRYVEPKGVDADGLAALPEGWVWASVEQVADQRLGKMLDKVKNKGTLLPYLRNINVRWFGFDLTDMQEMRVKDEELDDISVRAGDLVVCEGGEPGRAAVWNRPDESVVIQKALHRVRPFVGVSVWYLAYRLAADAGTGGLERYFTGSTIKHFTGQSLRAYAFPLPPTAEQHRIVAEVERRLSVAQEVESTVAASLRRAERLRQSILKRAFEGRLVAQDADNESASALLSGIRRQ